VLVLFRGVLSPPGGALEPARALHCNRIGGFVRELLFFVDFRPSPRRFDDRFFFDKLCVFLPMECADSDRQVFFIRLFVFWFVISIFNFGDFKISRKNRLLFWRKLII